MNIYQAIDINIQDRLDALPDGDVLEARPAFYRIALELSYLDKLSDKGWWQDWGGCMYAETLLRDFGPIVADAAATCEVGGEWRGGTITLLNAMEAYMHWQLNVASDSGDEEEMRLTEELLGAVRRLGDHLEGKWDKEATEAAA